MLPNGTRDEFGRTAEIKENIQNRLVDQFKNRGFSKLITPVLEYADVFAPLNSTDYRPYQLLDEKGETMVLRPDLTLPVARVLSTTGVSLPVKWYYSGDVFRLKKQLSGSYNQLTQAGIEIIGYQDLKADFECIATALDGCSSLGINEAYVQLSHAKFIDDVLNILPLPDPAKESLKAALFEKDLSKFDKLIAPLEKTDFAPFIKEWPWLFGDFDEVMTILKKLPKNSILNEITKELQNTKDFIAKEYPQYQVTMDLSIQAPQSYYTGIVFQGFTEESPDYLFSGGRYNNLLQSFQNQNVPAVGVAFDIDALVSRFIGNNSSQQTLVYFDDSQWAKANQFVKETKNATLCLANTLEQAKTIAEQTNSKLIDLSKEEANQ